MKKNYIEPSVSVVNVKVKTSLLTGSNPQSQALTVGGEEISSSNDIGSRRMTSVWGDEEEEE